MLYESDLNDLISLWNNRANNPSYSDDYLLALKECIFELNDTISSVFDEETAARRFLEEQEADSYLSTIEAHDVPS